MCSKALPYAGKKRPSIDDLINLLFFRYASLMWTQEIGLVQIYKILIVLIETWLVLRI